MAKELLNPPAADRAVSVLVVEDDQRVREAIARVLSGRGRIVTAVANGADAVREVAAGGPDVVVLDLGLPDIDGADVLPMIRAVSDVPVVVATARDDEREVVRLLDAGADDYVTKPFSAEQIDARIRAVLRRSRTPGDRPPPLVVGELSIDETAREARFGGELLELSRKEFDLLACLAHRAGEVVTRRELLAQVWRQPYGGADKTIDVHISWLRRKLGETADRPRYLQTVRGVGVKLVPPP